ETLALAGYERVERADERGQFAVRGGLVDVCPTTGREPLRIECWGDEIEQMRAFSPFTQRALHPVETAVIYPAAERRLDLFEPTLVGEDQPIPIPTDLVRAVPGGPDLVWHADEVHTVWEEEGLEPVPFGKAALLDTLPASQPFAFEAQRPALVARGLSEAENELGAFVRSGQRVVVAFPHLGEALRQQNLLRRIEARVIAEGEELPREAGLIFAVTPARRGFVWRDLGLVLLPDTQVFRKRPPRERESVRELAGELLALYAQRQQAPGVTYDLRHEYLERLEAEFPYRETPDQQAAIEAVKEDLEAPRPMDRLVCGDVGFGKTEVA